MDEQPSTEGSNKLQLELDASENRFRLLVESVKDYAIYMLDLEGIVLTWNEGAERITGYLEQEILGRNFALFYPEESVAAQEPKKQLAAAASDGRFEEDAWRVRKGGDRFWANIVITPLYENGKVIGFAEVTRDLSERKLAGQNEQVFKLLVDSVQDYAIFMLDPNGLVMTWNEGAERIKGYKANEIIGKHFSQFYTREAQKRRHPERELDIARETGRYEEEGWRIRKDGSLLWASVVITAIFDNKRLIGFAKVTRDLTQRLLADQERQASAQILHETNRDLRQALEVKSRFLSTISHEVRTPMAAIIGMTELLNTEDLGEDHNNVVQNIFDSSKRLLQLLNNLLESARMEAGELSLENRDFPIRVILGDVRQMVIRNASAKDLKLIGTCDSHVPEVVCGDELKVRQVLLNLVHNAVKFTERGEVNLSAEVTHRGASTVNIRFSVKDTGIGIKAEDREKLFKPFSQAEDSTKRIYGGSGLGLNISKRLVELMGGTLSFESEYEKGSRFWCDIPFSVKSEAHD